MKKDYKLFIIIGLVLILLFVVYKLVLSEKDTYEIYLNGSNDEYYFINEYIDKGARALKNKQDVSSQIISKGNVVTDIAGDYEVIYSIYDDKNKEYSVKRNVHIIDLELTSNVDKNNHKILITIESSDYDYVILPDESREYSRNIEYQYNALGTYDFKIVLKNGLTKEYQVKIDVYDNEGPKVDCKISLVNEIVKFNINASDDSGISKYVINGKEYNSNDVSISLDEFTSKKITVYDASGNYTETTCEAKIDSAFKDIVTTKSGYIKCNSDVSEDNKKLRKIVDLYGEKTRDSVVASALFLTNYKYNIAYSWGGKYLNIGLNSNWGCKVEVTKDTCTKSLGNNTCEGGLDCTGFTSWAYAQAGFDKSIIRTSSQSTGMWGNFNAQSHRYSFTGNQDKVNLIKVGDIVHTEGHVGIVIGINDDTLQVANMVGPIKITIIKKSNGNSINNQHSFDNFVLFDDFFAMYGK